MIALLAALPSVVWGVWGSGFISDDFTLTLLFLRDGLAEATRFLAFDAPARPAAAPYYLVTYGTIGEHPLAHAVLLALLNAGAAVGVWLVGRRLLSDRAALAAALLFAVVPNRAATRFWFVTGPYVLALGIVLMGAYLLLTKRAVAPAILFTVATLMYEGVVGLVLAFAALHLLEDVRSRWRRTSLVLVPVTIATVLMYLNSPKRDDPERPFDNIDTLGSAQIGQGLWGSRPVGWVGALLVIGLVMIAITSCLPGFRARLGQLGTDARAACLVWFGGALSFAAAGAPFGTEGIFDRNNLMGVVGVCLLLGSGVSALTRVRPLTGRVALSVLVLVMGSAIRFDLTDYRRAVDKGEAMFDQIVDEVRPDQRLLFVGPALDQSSGVAQFILDRDLNAALRLRDGERWSAVYLPANCEKMLKSVAPQLPLFFDHEERTIYERVKLDRCGFANDATAKDL